MIAVLRVGLPKVTTWGKGLSFLVSFASRVITVARVLLKPFLLRLAGIQLEQLIFLWYGLKPGPAVFVLRLWVSVSMFSLETFQILVELLSAVSGNVLLSLELLLCFIWVFPHYLAFSTLELFMSFPHWKVKFLEEKVYIWFILYLLQLFAWYLAHSRFLLKI